MRDPVVVSNTDEISARQLLGTGITGAPEPHISNGTILTVTLVVNGQSIGDFSSNIEPPTIDVAALPPIPWNLQARSPSGRVLTSLQVQPGDGQANNATGQFVDLLCGRLWIWVGGVRPDAPAAPAASKGGDCAP